MERNEQLQKLPEVLVPWFQKYGRLLPWRENPTPYHVWISEIMLQQTRIETVKPYYARFLEEIPDIRSLAEADPEHLEKLWEGLGYYSRVRNLQKAARQIMEKYQGIFPDTAADIRSLQGIGDYTAGAIASICFDLPVPAVDGNVLRVLSRITGDPRPVTDEKVRQAVRNDLSAVYPKGNCGAFTEALMELGETICLPHGVPDCSSCPCCSFCFSKDGAWEKIPVKAAKKERKQEKMTVFLFRCNEETAVRKRKQSGLLSGMWEFPNVPGVLSREEAVKAAAGFGCEPETIESECVRKHIFTHVEWDMHCYTIHCSRQSEEFLWVSEKQLREEIALPTAFRKLL